MSSNVILPSHFVGVGASAGGLEALEALFEQMPVDSDAAFILVQHLSPDRESLMPELIAKHTHMQVHSAENGMLVLANHLYLIPPGFNMRIAQGRLQLSEQDRSQGVLNLPIDTFLSSLAEDQRDKAVAIILSGTGSDGTLGIRMIKENVGMVMVQSEESASFDGMPHSAIATGIVDYVLTPEEMPEQLLCYLQHPFAKKRDIPESLRTSEEELGRIFLLLRDHTGIDFSNYKSSTVIRRIERRMTVNQSLSLSDYVQTLESDTQELSLLHKDLLIGVTRFFRDRQPFEVLRNRWLPELIREKIRDQEDTLRIWVVACSTGEEAYSLAILVNEILYQMNVALSVKIFATDVDLDAIGKAGQGAYSESIVADVPVEYLKKYFVYQDGIYQVSRKLRETVVFAHHNVLKDPPFTKIDLISCRNLLIYMQSSLQQKVMSLFNFSLGKGGLMLLGSGETVGEFDDTFKVVDRRQKIYRTKGRRSYSQSSSGLSAVGERYQATRRQSATAGLVGQRKEEQLLDRLVQGVTELFFPFTMVVDENMELLHVVGDPTPYLKVPTGKMLRNVAKLAYRDLVAPLTTGVQRAIKQHELIAYNNVRLHYSEEDGELDLAERITSIRFIPLPTRKGQEQLLAITIEDAMPQLAGEAVHGENYNIGEEERLRLADLENELQFTRENLQATVEELETTNEELLATNEELLSSNEELQSTNEELQSVNEELYTVNAEYQDKISELTDVNNDLDNLLMGTQIASMFLDSGLNVRRFTPEITRFINVLKSDIGRPFSHFTHHLVEIELRQMLQQVQESKQSLEQEVMDRDGHHYLMRILPYRLGPEIYSGLVLTFVNIDSAVEMRSELQRSEAHYRMALNVGRIVSWEWHSERGTFDFSDNVAAVFGEEIATTNLELAQLRQFIEEAELQRLRQLMTTMVERQQRAFGIAMELQLAQGRSTLIGEGQLEYDANGQPRRAVGIVQNTTLPPPYLPATESETTGE